MKKAKVQKSYHNCDYASQAIMKVEKISTYDYQIKAIDYYLSSADAIADTQKKVALDEKGAFRLYYFTMYIKCTDHTWKEYMNF